MKLESPRKVLADMIAARKADGRTRSTEFSQLREQMQQVGWAPTPLSAEQFQALIDRRNTLADEKGLPPITIRDVYQRLFDEEDCFAMHDSSDSANC